MARNALSIRDRFAALSNPAKALVFVGLAGAVSLVIAAIVVTGSPNRGQTTVVDEQNNASGSTQMPVSAAASSMQSGSQPATAAAASAMTQGSTSEASGAGKTTGNKSESSKSQATSDAGTDENPGTESPKAPPVLTAELRKKIAAELVAAEKRAAEEAAAKYPADPKKGGNLDNAANYEQLRSDLIDLYTSAIVKKYGLTTEQTIDILILDAGDSN